MFIYIYVPDRYVIYWKGIDRVVFLELYNGLEMRFLDSLQLSFGSLVSSETVILLHDLPGVVVVDEKVSNKQQWF